MEFVFGILDIKRMIRRLGLSIFLKEFHKRKQVLNFAHCKFISGISSLSIDRFSSKLFAMCTDNRILTYESQSNYNDPGFIVLLTFKFFSNCSTDTILQFFSNTMCCFAYFWSLDLWVFFRCCLYIWFAGIK